MAVEEAAMIAEKRMVRGISFLFSGISELFG
jgi:hypothetical protein